MFNPFALPAPTQNPANEHLPLPRVTPNPPVSAGKSPGQHQLQMPLVSLPADHGQFLTVADYPLSPRRASDSGNPAAAAHAAPAVPLIFEHWFEIYSWTAKVK
jgi:hypothetical protein